ncbi:MAG: KH domain-containing protein [Fusobacteriaceae bacterium]
MEKLEKLLQFMVEELTEIKEEIRITYEVIDETIIFRVSVAKGEMGRLIGKNGLTATAIRGVMQAAGVKDKLNVNVEFID